MSADEVIAYSMGFDARVVNAASVRPYVAVSKLAQEFAHRIDLVERAVADGELKLPTNWPAFVAFARTHRLSLPARLTEALGTSVVAVPHPPNRSTEEAQRLQARVNELEQKLAEPHPRRYRSALLVIRGTAIKKYGHRPGAATSPAPAAMAKDTGPGKNCVSDDTVRSLLKDADEQAEADTPNSDSS